MGLHRWMHTWKGMLAELEELQEPHVGLVEELTDMLRYKIFRYPSFCTFLFRVEFQWFLMALSVLRTQT